LEKAQHRRKALCAILRQAGFTESPQSSVWKRVFVRQRSDNDYDIVSLEIERY